MIIYERREGLRNYLLYVLRTVFSLNCCLLLFFLLSKDTSYFDDPFHSTGALTSNLATHASAVQGVSKLAWPINQGIF